MKPSAVENSSGHRDNDHGNEDSDSLSVHSFTVPVSSFLQNLFSFRRLRFRSTAAEPTSQRVRAACGRQSTTRTKAFQRSFAAILAQSLPLESPCEFHRASGHGGSVVPAKPGCDRECAASLRGPAPKQDSPAVAREQSLGCGWAPPSCAGPESAALPASADRIFSLPEQWLRVFPAAFLQTPSEHVPCSGSS